jgi:hypothetical protein
MSGSCGQAHFWLEIGDRAGSQHDVLYSPKSATIALGAMLLLGILQGILFAALASISMLLFSLSRPHMAFLGRMPIRAAIPTLTVIPRTRHCPV